MFIESKSLSTARKQLHRLEYVANQNDAADHHNCTHRISYLTEMQLIAFRINMLFVNVTQNTYMWVFMSSLVLQQSNRRMSYYSI